MGCAVYGGENALRPRIRAGLAIPGSPTYQAGAATPVNWSRRRTQSDISMRLCDRPHPWALCKIVHEIPIHPTTHRTPIKGIHSTAPDGDNRPASPDTPLRNLRERPEHKPMLAWIAFYFLLVVTALALVFLPEVRRWAWSRWSSTRTYSVRMSTGVATQGRRQADLVSDTVGYHWHSGRHWIVQHKVWALSGVVLVVGLPMLALALKGWMDLGSFDHRQSHAINEEVQALLQGEQLVPPPPLPPEMFATQEVEMARPMIRTASREWSLLDATFQQRLLVVFKLMQEQHGYEMVLLEGYRSPERQARLAAMGGHVTRAGANMSYHQHGLAADCAFKRNGKVIISERDPWAMKGYELYGQVAQSAGLTWGGAWRSIKDYGHVELRRPGVLGKAPRSGDNAAPAEFSGDFAP
jgi:peptidoglycan LD-endopeptidase CwlK